MTNCEDYEIALEQRGRGVLSPDDEGQLEAHLAGCETCRAYAAVTRQMEGDMMQAAASYRNRVQTERKQPHSDLMGWFGIAMLVLISGALVLWPIWLVGGALVYFVHFARPSGNFLADEALRLDGWARGLLGAAAFLGAMLVAEGLITAGAATVLGFDQKLFSGLIIKIMAIQMAASAGLIVYLLARRAEFARRRNRLR